MISNVTVALLYPLRAGVGHLGLLVKGSVQSPLYSTEYARGPH
jgi:hypothetical protein